MTQNQVILSDLKSGATITSLQAFHRYGTVSLQKRLSEIRKDLPKGWQIRDMWTVLSTGKRVKTYWLHKGRK